MTTPVLDKRMRTDLSWREAIPWGRRESLNNRPGPEELPVIQSPGYTMPCRASVAMAAMAWLVALGRRT